MTLLGKFWFITWYRYFYIDERSGTGALGTTAETMTIAFVILGQRRRRGRSAEVWIVSFQIHIPESKPSDIHGVVCETTKFAVKASEASDQSDSGCFFVTQTYFLRAVFRGTIGLNNTRPFKSNDGSINERKCSEVIKSGFSNAIKSHLSNYFLSKTLFVLSSVLDSGNPPRSAPVNLIWYLSRLTI